MHMRKPPVIATVVFCIICLSCAIVLLSYAANTPAQAGAIYTQNVNMPDSKLTLTPVKVTNSYASFDYPSIMTLTSNNALASHELANYTFAHPDLVDWNMAIEVMYVASGRLQDNNSYEFRHVHPEQYIETNILVGTNKVDVMTDSTYGGFSKVAFLTHGPYQAVISLYGDNESGLTSLQKTFNMVLSSWKWSN
jgi:hypothetical protein